jgi:NAD(P)-dependent dehydrogenase (short-subunit alcohol dehydrogenase family)
MKKQLLIFGANGALGKGITESLIHKDYDSIYLFDFRFDKDLESDKARKIIIGDLSAEENVISAFKSVTPSQENFYFLYSTIGGFSGGKALWDIDSSEWDKMINMNLKSAFLIAKHFARIVNSSAGGSICFTAAFTGINPEKNKSAYGVSKSGLIHLVKSLALEGEKIKLSVNAIAPYIIDTPANREWMKDSDYSSWVKPTEIGEFAHDLFKNFNFITGNIISITKRFDIGKNNY